jgi:hypothetical protein
MSYLLIVEMNFTLWSFLEDQITIFKFLVKNCYTTQLFYDHIYKNQNFFKLKMPLYDLESITKTDLNKKDILSNLYDETRRNTNTLQSEIKIHQKNSNGDIFKEGFSSENSEDILNEKYNEQLIKNHFDFLFSQSMTSTILFK